MSTTIDHEKIALDFWTGEINTYVAKGKSPWGYAVYDGQSYDFDTIAKEYLKKIRGHAPAEAHERFWEAVNENWNPYNSELLHSLIAEADLEKWLNERDITDADDIQSIRNILDDETFIDDSDSVNRLMNVKIPLTLAPYQAENFNYEGSQLMIELEKIREGEFEDCEESVFTHLFTSQGYTLTDLSDGTKVANSVFLRTFAEAVAESYVKYPVWCLIKALVPVKQALTWISAHKISFEVEAGQSLILHDFVNGSNGIVDIVLEKPFRFTIDNSQYIPEIQIENFYGYGHQDVCGVDDEDFDTRISQISDIDELKLTLNLPEGNWLVHDDNAHLLPAIESLSVTIDDRAPITVGLDHGSLTANTVIYSSFDRHYTESVSMTTLESAMFEGAEEIRIEVRVKDIDSPDCLFYNPTTKKAVSAIFGCVGQLEIIVGDTTTTYPVNAYITKD